MLKHSVLAIFAIVTVCPCVSHAGDIKAPFELETAQTLPGGIGNPRYKNLFMSVTDWYADDGSSLGLGWRLNKQVTWGDIMDAQDDDTQRANIKGLLAKAGIDENGSPGSTTGVVNTYANIKVPILAYGITDRLTLALAVPVINVDVSTDTGFARSADGQKFVDAAGQDGSPVKADEAATKLNDAINQKLRRLGYEPIHDQTISGVGDMKLVAKYNLLKDAKQAVSIKGDITLPTGTPLNVDKALDVPTGDGQWDVGAGLIYDRFLTQDLRWNTFGYYNYQTADHLWRRIPRTDDDPLSADKEYVARKLGDQIAVGTSLNYYFPSVGMSVGGGYNFQYQLHTTFDGTAYSPERYAYLEHLFPLQELHTLTLMTGFSTVEWFQQKKFVYPFQANLAYSHPLAGRNVTENDVLAGELVLFF